MHIVRKRCSTYDLSNGFIMTGQSISVGNHTTTETSRIEVYLRPTDDLRPVSSNVPPAPQEITAGGWQLYSPTDRAERVRRPLIVTPPGEHCRGISFR